MRRIRQGKYYDEEALAQRKDEDEPVLTLNISGTEKKQVANLLRPKPQTPDPTPYPLHPYPTLSRIPKPLPKIPQTLLLLNDTPLPQTHDP